MMQFSLEFSIVANQWTAKDTEGNVVGSIQPGQPIAISNGQVFPPHKGFRVVIPNPESPANGIIIGFVDTLSEGVNEIARFAGLGLGGTFGIGSDALAQA